MSFLSTYIDVKTVNFSRLLNPDWSIQISRPPAVYMQGETSRGARPQTPLEACAFGARFCEHHLHFKLLQITLCRPCKYLN